MPPDAPALADVIAALEAATEADERLDMRVWQAAGRAIYDYDCADDEVPQFTASLDAALTLVPDGMLLQLSDWDAEVLRQRGPWQAILAPRGSRDTLAWEYRCDHARTPAIALCIAALRARAAQGTRDAE